jgi:hypothetical protein
VEGRCGGGSMTRDGGVMRLGHPTPQSDGVIDADVAGQVPVAQAIVRIGYGCLLSAWWIRVLPNFAKEPTLAPWAR